MEEEQQLKRFLDAQAYDYPRALAEIRAGRKESHWIWYIFPQLQGLGHSEMCRIYGIHGMEEAKAYLAEPTLRARLLEISQALLELGSSDPVSVMGSIDARKLCSCMTLFDAATDSIGIFRQVLAKFYQGKPDPLTLRMLTSEQEKTDPATKQLFGNGT